MQKIIKDVFGDYSKNNAITKFINDLNVKNQKQIKDIFIKELDKFKVDAELVINRKEIILSEYISANSFSTLFFNSIIN